MHRGWRGRFKATLLYGGKRKFGFSQGTTGAETKWKMRQKMKIKIKMPWGYCPGLFWVGGWMEVATKVPVTRTVLACTVQ